MKIKKEKEKWIDRLTFNTFDDNFILEDIKVADLVFPKNIPKHIERLIKKIGKEIK